MSDGATTNVRRWETEVLQEEIKTHIVELVSKGKHPVIVIEDNKENGLLAGMFIASLYQDFEMPLVLCPFQEGPRVNIKNADLTARTISIVLSLPLEVLHECVWVLDRRLDIEGNVGDEVHFSGDDVAARLIDKGINAHKIIMCSSDDVITDKIPKGVDFLLKPYNHADLKSSIDRALAVA